MANERRILVGAILGPHGVRGLLRARSFTEAPETLFDFDSLTDEQGARVFKLERKSAAKDLFIVAIDGVTDRQGADALRGVKLYAARSAFPKTKPREYYEADLIGLAAKTQEDKTVGSVIALHDYGAGSFLEIQPVNGASFMLPFNDAFVPELDLEAKRMTVVIPEGWLSEPPNRRPARKKPTT